MTNDICDIIFKALMSDKKFFIGFCQSYLSAEYLDKVDLETAELFKFQNKYRRARQSIDPEKTSENEISGTVYSLKYKDKTNDDDGVFIVYVQNLNDPPKEVVLQIEANRLGIMIEWSELHPEQSLPIVLPIIYHYGTKPFAGPLDVFELFEDPKMAKHYFYNPIMISSEEFEDFRKKFNDKHKSSEGSEDLESSEDLEGFCKT